MTPVVIFGFRPVFDMETDLTHRAHQTVRFAHTANEGRYHLEVENELRSANVSAWQHEALSIFHIQKIGLTTC